VKRGDLIDPLIGGRVGIIQNTFFLYFLGFDTTRVSPGKMGFSKTGKKIK